MPIVQEVKDWLAVQLASKMGVVVPAETGQFGSYEMFQLPVGVVLLSSREIPGGGREIQTISLDALASVWQSKLPVGIVLSGQLAEADFAAFRTALAGTGHKPYVDAWRAEGLI